MEIYRDIDMKQTGERIKLLMEEKEISVKEIQKKLYLSCPQSIYRWFQGKILSSVNHLYMLSKILNVHMEEMIVEKTVGYEIELGRFSTNCFKHCLSYYSKQFDLKNNAI